MVFKINIKKLIISLLIPLVAGGLSSLITGKDMDIYNTVERPPLSPPSIVFPIVWAVLYILMGISLYLYWQKSTPYSKKKGYLYFAISLFLNFLWSPVFFSARMFLLALFILFAMWIFVLLTILEYKKVSKWAAYLQIPYLVWLTIAFYLNAGIYLLNK